MDAFWGVTLSVIAISMFWKRQNKRNSNIQYEKEKQERAYAKEQDRINKAMFAAMKGKPQPPPLTLEEQEAKKQEEKDIAELKKLGYDDELIAVILPTINSGE